MTSLTSHSTPSSSSANKSSLSESQPVLITNSTLQVTPRLVEDRDALIATAAYLLAEQRGFAAGRELDDWLAAEAEIDQQFMSGRVF